MNLISTYILGPFGEMAAFPAGVLETVIAGLGNGFLYALVAIGFVIIFKSSSVFNFAQGRWCFSPPSISPACSSSASPGISRARFRCWSW